MMMPAIIIIHIIMAAADLRSGATCVAMSARSEVPQAPTPTPMSTKAKTASAIPDAVSVAIHAVAIAAAIAPAARIASPPIIQGVRRPPWSEP